MTDRYAVVGNPIAHSKSPLIHSTFARQSGQDMEYGAIEPGPAAFNSAVDTFRQAGGRGINITAPFKLAAFAYATHRQPRARLAGASNCLKFEGDRVVAENFDGVGLVADVQNNLGVSLRGRRVLMLGAGGAVRGALLPFLEQQPVEFVIANRDVAKARKLFEEFAPFGTFAAGGYDDIGSRPFDVVLNATSASLRGELPPVPSSAFSTGCVAYELAYGKGLTPFLQLAEKAGAGKLADGVGMLVEQAAEAFLWWRGVRPQTSELIKRLTVPLL